MNQKINCSLNEDILWRLKDVAADSVNFKNYLNFYCTIRNAQLTCCCWLNFEHQYVSGGICYFHSVATLLYVKLALWHSLMQYNLPVDTKRKYLRVVESAILCLQHSFGFREINPTSNQTKITNLFSRKRTSSTTHELSIHEFSADYKVPFPWSLCQKYEIIPN